MKPKDGIRPPGGWKYTTPEGVIIEAAQMEELVEMVSEHRIFQKQVIGDVLRDISNQICSLYPAYCNPEPSDHKPEPPEEDGVISKTRKPHDRMLIHTNKLVNRAPQGGFSIVSKQQAITRAMTCSVCPRNQIFQWPCSSCKGAYDMVSSRLTRLNTIPSSLPVGSCGVSGADNKLCAWLSLDDLKLSIPHVRALPDNCWKLKETREAQEQLRKSETGEL